MNNDFEDRLALVTGSATGLGASMAIKLAERGADVIVNYSRSATEAEETADEVRSLGRNVKLVQADVAIPEDCVKLAEAAQNREGGLDI